MARTLLNAVKQIRAGTIDSSLLSTELQNQLSTLDTDLQGILDVMSTDSGRIAAFSALTAAFEGADSTLQGALNAAIDSWNSDIATEQTARSNADAALQTLIEALTTQVNAIDAAYKAADNTEASARAAADATLQASIDDLSNTVTQLQANLTTEIARAQAAEAALVSNQKHNIVLTGALDGVNTDFTVPEPFHAHTLEVFYNGQALLPTDDYTVTAQVVTMVSAPDAGDKVWANYHANPA